MARLALGAKWGRPGSPPAASTSAAEVRPPSSRVASAASPRPPPALPKKWRRLSINRCSSRGSMVGSFPGDRLVEVHDEAGRRRVGGQLDRVEPLVARGLAGGDQ